MPDQAPNGSIPLGDVEIDPKTGKGGPGHYVLRNQRIGYGGFNPGYFPKGCDKPGKKAQPKPKPKLEPWPRPPIIIISPFPPTNKIRA
jgi:hypothetical protein